MFWFYKLSKSVVDDVLNFFEKLLWGKATPIYFVELAAVIEVVVKAVQRELLQNVWPEI